MFREALPELNIDELWQKNLSGLMICLRLQIMSVNLFEQLALCFC